MACPSYTPSHTSSRKLLQEAKDAKPLKDTNKEITLSHPIFRRLTARRYPPLRA